MYEIVLPIGVKHGKVAAPARSQMGTLHVNEEQQPQGSGWTAAKVVGLVIGLLLMVGFGLCGLLGVAVVVMFPPGSAEIFGSTAAGFAIAILGFLLARKMVRDARRNG
jgi:hypothetical protein